MKITVNLPNTSYDVIVERGCIASADRYLDLDRRVLVVTDDGVPTQYMETIASLCAEPYTVCVPMGEESKSIETYSRLLQTMLEGGFTRGDCVVAVGGGVVGDLSGFAASSYMRGIDFYNIPTTVLSQIDSSIGGKTAINFCGVKNAVGAFYQPKRVLIDPNVLSTLPKRQFANGLAEAVKMALTSDRELFEMLENGRVEDNIGKIIVSCLNIKKDIVEKDEKESSLRRILNFGHTIGHGIESASKGALYHGECVALGLLPMCDRELVPRVKAVLCGLGLPTECKCNADAVVSAMLHDKKFGNGYVTVVKVDEIGRGYLKKISAEKLESTARSFLREGV